MSPQTEKVTSRSATKLVVFSRSLKGKGNLVRIFTRKEGVRQNLVRETD